MASNMGVVGVCALSVGIVFIDNVTTGRDPVPAVVAGGVFTLACVGISELDVDFGMAVAVVFLLGNLLLKSGTVLNLVTGLTGSKSRTNSNSSYNYGGKSTATVYHPTIQG